MSDAETSNLSSLYKSAEKTRAKLSQIASSTTTEYQDILTSALKEYQQCRDVATRTSIFSANESIDDVASPDIQYLMIDFWIADLVPKQMGGDRKDNIRTSQGLYVEFLKRIDSYDIMQKNDHEMLERYQEAPSAFSVAAASDPAAKRDIKIKRLKAEKELKQRLASLRSQSHLSEDDDLIRDLSLQEIALAVHEAFQQLESINQELHILSLAPPPSQGEPTDGRNDARDRARANDGYSERLDGPLSAGLTGPLLDGKGRPMRPFTLLDKRQQLRDGVFRPDHSLPTMTIDEYLDEERRRGGMIEGGGPQSGMAPEPDEDNYEKVDAETLKARAWDDFKDENPKGAGNTLNRG